ncbi:MAG: fumarylacetoacetate hydrolase [Burkholderiales bacterium]|nr:fumarylacetoacetate hydrolase [Burkholderiales bacterium]
MNSQRAAIGAALLASAFAAPAACLTDAEAAALFDSYASRTPATLPPMTSEADAACSRTKLNALLLLQNGKVVGYKAGLTNPAVQKRFGADKPVWGVLYDGMILDDGATVEAAFGARPLFEADMLVRVKSADINRAKTPMDVLESIDQIIPFIELPDLVVAPSQALNGNGISAINVGARLGVAGKPIAVPAFRGERFAMIDALRDMTVVVIDTNGAELSRGKGSDILEHPLNAVVWLAEALARQGLAMEPGQVISLGSFSPLTPPKPGQKVTVRYDGLPGATPVSVTFR